MTTSSDLHAGGTAATGPSLFAAARMMARSLLQRAEVDRGNFTLTLDADALAKALGVEDGLQFESSITITQATRVVRDGKGTKLIFGSVSIHEPHVDHGLLDQLKIAHRWYALLASGQHPSISSLARSERVDPSEVSRTITLAFLAPDIVRMILRGTQPASLTLDRLRRARPLPACWKEQRQLLIG